MQPDVFEVSFTGNAYTDLGTVRQYALVRCAELTVEHGFDHFVLVRADSTTSRSATAINNSAWEDSRHTAFLTCRVGKGPKPPDNVDAYDAKFLLSSVEVKR